MNLQCRDLAISIVIPVYNESARIGTFLKDIIAYLQDKSFSYQIIIADDGSTDATVEIIDGMLSKALPDRYRIVSLPQNRGKGGALQVGMQEADYEYVLFLDADGSTSITELDNFMPCFSKDYDVYISVRTKKHDAPFKRKFFGYGYIFLANFILGLNISDFTCGFKCYRKEAARKIFSLQTLDNWSYDTEDLFIANKFGYRIKEIPVYWKHVGGSKVKVLHNVIVCGIDLFRIKINDIKNKYI
ncbi:MAG: glycosyltransferase family 2 protein [Deltaproteobacteria bacterium]|nr:glycosyltransferase family 2 protein [Deltaproteobacteria bacterium]